ncbi:glutaredoxin family protein [Leucobacter sp. M11]|uniref:glutaredoxin family protein n=1 Tax=Leucobacter sp. M11 TaxID=2993565 RepID=UPI002D7FD5BE|nr:glutaredoxin domain-containing protein [Leucobacter sp. M11]MEB4615306.1 NrdH-redoxin [Leucobacter sp. M11]
MTNQNPTKVTMYGADWCGDCRRAEKLFTAAGIDWEYIDLIEQESEVATAKAISGRTQIPVVVYPDGSHQVEPSNQDMTAKLRELGLVPAAE